MIDIQNNSIKEALMKRLIDIFQKVEYKQIEDKREKL